MFCLPELAASSFAPDLVKRLHREMCQVPPPQSNERIGALIQLPADLAERGGSSGQATVFTTRGSSKLHRLWDPLERKSEDRLTTRSVGGDVHSNDG